MRCPVGTCVASRLEAGQGKPCTLHHEGGWRIRTDALDVVLFEDPVCDDGVGCTVDTCSPPTRNVTGADASPRPTTGCVHRPATAVFEPVCTPTGCTTAIAAGAPCLDPDNACVTGGICDSGGTCEPQAFRDCSAFANACTDAFCDPDTGDCRTSTTNREGRSCDDGDACTATASVALVSAREGRRSSARPNGLTAPVAAASAGGMGWSARLRGRASDAAMASASAEFAVRQLAPSARSTSSAVAGPASRWTSIASAHDARRPGLGWIVIASAT